MGARRPVMGCDSARVAAVASALSALGIDGVEAFDEEEPEWGTLETLSKRYDSDAHLGLLAIMAGLSDFQLANDARRTGSPSRRLGWNTGPRAASPT